MAVLEVPEKLLLEQIFGRTILSAKKKKEMHSHAYEKDTPELNNPYQICLC